GFASECPLPCSKKQSKTSPQQATNTINSTTVHKQSFKIEHYPWIFGPSRAQTSTVRMYSFPLHNINQQRKGLKPSPTARAVSRSPLDDSVASASIAGGNIRSLRLSGIRPATGRPWPSASPRIFVQPQAPAGTSVPLGFRASARRPVGLGHRRRLGSFAGPVTATSQQTID